MVRKLDPSDFRAFRMVLEPDDFALGDDEPDTPPADLVDEKVWHGIMDIADDVAIRTTSYQGSRIGLLHELWGDWLEVMPEAGIVSEAMLDCSDDFAASMLSLIHGFYKQAIATLRSALETMVFACACQLAGDQKRWEEWQKGEELRFGDTRARIRAAAPIKALEDRAKAATGQTIFADRSSTYQGG